MREASGSELASRSASELESASLHQSEAASRPKMLKPAVSSEAMGECSCWASRGERRRRVRTEQPRNLGDPAWCAAGRNAAGESITLRAATAGSRTGS